MQRRRTGALVAAALAATGAMVACSPSDDGVPVLTWYANNDAGGQATIAQECTEEADGAWRIELAALPREASSQREQFARRLAANDSSIDIMSLDPPFIPEFARAGFLAPVPDELADAVSEASVEGTVDSSTFQDELVAVPFWGNTQLLWYRVSVAEEAGLDMEQPVTWDQIIEAASATDTTVAAQGIRAESLTVWVNALIASAGGEIITGEAETAADVEVVIDSDAAREAARIMRTISDEGLGGPGLGTADEAASWTLFQGDSGGFMVNWPYVWPAAADGVDSGAMSQEFIDDMGWAMFPQTVEGQEARPPVGGINLGVSAFSEHVDASYEAIACIVEPERQAQYFITDGNPPANMSAYDVPEVAEAFPMAGLIRESLENAAPRPKTPFYNEVTIGLQRTWHPIDRLDPESTPATSGDLISAALREEALL